jgi:hypothetical protein
METSAVQRLDTNAIVNMVVPVVWGVMEGAMKVGGLHLTASMREGGAASKYIRQSQGAYKANPIIAGVTNSIIHSKGEREKVDLKSVDPAEVMKKVDEIVPILEAEREQGTQTKTFIYGLAKAMVGASGSGFMGTGEKVNENESKFLADLKAHLRI